MIKIIVAFDEKRGIGHQGKIPWFLPEDMQHFRRTTINNAVIMGRNTWTSISRPLLNRRNIVVSKTLPFLRGIEIVPSLEEAFQLTNNDCFVIGGQQIYESTLPIAQLIIASHIKGTYPADVYFPSLDSSIWIGSIIKSYPGFDVCEYKRRG